jgi:hypothetical protein
MLDANKISLDAIGAVQAHFNEIARQLYFLPLDIDPVEPLIDSPLKHRISLLVSVANGESHHEGEVAEALLSVVTLLDHVRGVPPEMQQVIQRCQLWLNKDELITLSEAARILRGEANDTTLRYVNEKIQRGKLKRYIDPNEPNPQRAGRVSRKDVEGLVR